MTNYNSNTGVRPLTCHKFPYTLYGLPKILTLYVKWKKFIHTGIKKS